MFVLKPGIPDLNRTPENLTLRKMKRPIEGLAQIEGLGSLGLITVRHFPKNCGNAAMLWSGKNTVKRNKWCKLKIKSENWCNSTLIFIGFAIESISSDPLRYSCPHKRFAGQSPAFSTIKPIKIYTSRILGRNSWERQRKTVSEPSR